jgi:tetratricopeptide (TPR) repeat protein
LPKERALECALEILDDKLPSPVWEQKAWQLWDRLAPHCRTLLARLRDHSLEPKAARMMNQLALWLKKRAEHSEAEPLLRRALEIAEKSYGLQHPNVATCLCNLGQPLEATNRLSEAEPLHRRALEIHEKSYRGGLTKREIKYDNVAAGAARPV